MRDFIEKKWFLFIWFLFLILCFIFIPNVKADDINVGFSNLYYYETTGLAKAVFDGYYMRPYNNFTANRSYSGQYSELSPNSPFLLPSANIPVGNGDWYFGAVRHFDATISANLSNGSNYKLVLNIFNTSTNVITNNLNFPNIKTLYSNAWNTGGVSNISSSYSYNVSSGILTITILFKATHDATGLYYELDSNSTGYNGQGQGQFCWNPEEISTSQFTLRTAELYRVTGDSGTDVIINQNNTIINQNSTQITQNNQMITNQQTQITQNNTTNQKLDEINASINNDNTSGASSSASSYFSNFSNNTHGLTGIITLPLTSIQRLTSSTCTALVVPIPYTNSNITLPCMTDVYNTYIPTIYNLWKVVSFGIIAYFICLDIFRMVKDFKDPNKDEIEVVDL